MNPSPILKGITFLCFLAFTWQILSCKSKETQKITIATLNYGFSACFSSGNSQLAIYKIGSKIFATIYSYRDEDLKIAVETRINQAQLDTFYLFVKSIRQFSNTNSFCTTSQDYTVRIGSEKIQKTDNSCSLDFDKIKNCLFRDCHLDLY